MSLQTQNLVMIGLGIEKDAPPSEWQPKLVDGIHLRWAFKPERGFPWHGYYLFRREHVTSVAIELVQSVSFMLPSGPLPKERYETLHGVIISDGKLFLTDKFHHAPEDPRLGINLHKRFFGFEFEQPSSTSRRVSVRIAFRETGSMIVTAYSFGKPVAQTTVKGEADQSGEVDLHADAITAVSIRPDESTSVKAVLVRLDFVPVDTDAGTGWELLHRKSISLPLTHPDYPCDSRPENLARARGKARRRIQYGKPEPFTDRCSAMHSAGTISVRRGSQIVSGDDTSWHDGLVGGTFRVRGERTVYTILAVMNEEKLLISRGYTGPTRSSVPYVIYGDEDEEDAFGQLYDHLVQLVAGGPAAGAMHERYTHQVQRMHDSGYLKTLSQGLIIICGDGTRWHRDLEGFGLQIIGARSGAVSLSHGSKSVELVRGDLWSYFTEGMSFRAAGDETTYTVMDVEPSTLTLDRLFEGASSEEKAYEIVDPTIYTIGSIDAEDQLTLEEAYQGPDWGEVDYAIVATPQTSGSEHDNPHLTRQSPLEMITLASLHPAVAQELGLYWIDEKAVSGVAYDYLIVADHRLGGGGISPDTQPGDIPGLLSLEGVDAYIVFNKKREPASRLKAPAKLRAYALPTHIGESGARNSAGLIWEPPAEKGGVRAEQPVMYLLWRAYLEGLEEDGPTAAPRAGAYKLISQDAEGRIKPILLPRLPAPSSGETIEPQRPGDWPPFQLSTIDRGGGNGRPPGLPDGWYSYCVAGMDLFGRHTPWSRSAQWRQWAPMPEPKPWYYKDPAGNKVINRYAVRLIDKTPPPPPSGVEAYALDPADPFVMKDAAYHAWRSTVEASTVGLRIRWQWTEAHHRQAPDTREFRIYYQPGRMNTLLGRITNVERVGVGYSRVETDILASHRSGKFVDCHLRIGRDAYRIEMSTDGDPTVLGLQFMGRREQQPQVGERFTLVIPDGHRFAKDYRDPAEWSQRIHVVGYDEHVMVTIPTGHPDGEELRRYEVFLPEPETGGVGLFEPTLADPIVYARIGVSATDDKEHAPDHREESPWGDRHGNEGWVGPVATAFRVLREPPDPPVPPPDSERVEATPADYHGHSYYTFRWQPQEHLKAHIFRALDDSIFRRDWLIHTTRTVLDPNLPRHRSYFPEKDSDGTPWRLSRQQIAANALNTITSLGSYRSLSDDAKTVLARLPGNEGQMWGESLQEWDWTIRMIRGGLTAEDTEYFPKEWYEPDDVTLRLKRGNIATELNDMILILTGSAATVSEEVVTLDGTLDLTPVRPYRDTLWLTADDEARNNRPYRIKAVDQATHTVTLDGKPRLASPTSAWAIYLDPYRDLGNDALRVLAGLPGNERAFTQITTRPLDPDDAECANQRGPNDPEDFEVWDSEAPPEPPRNPLENPDLRIYTDTLPGRSTNRYFYRAAYVDGAHNRSSPSLSSPPVYLPNVVPPKAPVITKVLGGDRKIILQWAASQEPNLHRYLVYRTADKGCARDLRLMGLPVADLPASTLVVKNGIIDLGSDTDAVTVERVYNAREFDPIDDPFIGESATQYLSAPIELTGSTISDHSAPNETEVVVVYRDSKGGVQRTPGGKLPRYWEDNDIRTNFTYYYLIVAARQIEYRDESQSICSLASRVASAQAYEQTPPTPIEIVNSEWMWGSEATTVDLEVSWSPDDTVEIRIMRRTSSSRGWKVVSEWLDGSLGVFHEKNVEHYYDNEMKTQTRRKDGCLFSESTIFSLQAFNSF